MRGVPSRRAEAATYGNSPGFACVYSDHADTGTRRAGGTLGEAKMGERASALGQGELEWDKESNGWEGP